jgi:hypothetical protein
MSLKFACFIHEAIFWFKAKLKLLGLLSSSAGVSGFPNCRMWDEKNFFVLVTLQTHPR